MTKTKQSKPEPLTTRPATDEEREEREAKIRAEMRATIEAKYARARERKPGGWCRVTGSRARCDNPKCRVRGRGSLRVYRVATSQHRYEHTTSVGRGGGVQHNMTQHTETDCILLCESCKFRQLVHEFGLDELLDEQHQLPPMAEVVELIGVYLDAERYSELRKVALRERATPTEPVVVPEIERRMRREKRANEADDLEPLPVNAVG